MDAVELIRVIELQVGVQLSEEDISDILITVYKIAKEAADLVAQRVYKKLNDK